MQCRRGCGACCIAPAINTPYYGMPDGKPAGLACVHLDANHDCLLFNDPRRPLFCEQFQAEEAFCGASFEEAFKVISEIELITQSNKT